MQFIQHQQEANQLPLDQVYTGKLCFGLWQEIDQGIYPRGSTILMLHTGGLQGLYPNKSSNTSVNLPNDLIVIFPG